MRPLRTTAILAGAALATGAAVLLVGPAQASSGSGSSAPAKPVPADATITWGGVVDDTSTQVPAGVTPAKPVPPGTAVTDGGVVGGASSSGAVAQPLPDGADITYTGGVLEVSGAELARILSGGTATGTGIAKPAPEGTR